MTMTSAAPGPLGFPEPPRPNTPAAGPEDFAAIADDLRRENAAITAERDRAVAEAKRLRDEQEATGLYRVVGAIARGIGAAVALTLAFGVLVGIVAAIALAVGWRP